MQILSPVLPQWPAVMVKGYMPPATLNPAVQLIAQKEPPCCVKLLIDMPAYQLGDALATSGLDISIFMGSSLSSESP